MRQVFARTYGCDLCCRYCDTPAAKAETGPCVVEKPAGSGNRAALRNPLTAAEVLEQIIEVAVPIEAHHSVSFTGGEPLLHASFVGELAAMCREAGLKTYLETNGQRIAELKTVVESIDIVAMDVKLSSSLGVDCGVEWEAMLTRGMAFLRAAREVEVFVKLICTSETPVAEVARVAEAVAGEKDDCLMVLQPVTPAAEVDAAPDARHMLALQAAASTFLPDVRVIPQCHLAMGML